MCLGKHYQIDLNYNLLFALNIKPTYFYMRVNMARNDMIIMMIYNDRVFNDT